MMLVTRERPDNDGEAHALRRYVSARAAGRTHPEFSRFDETIGAWIGCTDTEVQGLIEGRTYRQLRRSGLPWCDYLGIDSRISDDIFLEAFFELYATEPHDWTGLLKTVTKNRRQALKDWRRLGRETLTRVRMQRDVSNGVLQGRSRSKLAQEFSRPGTGMRSLKKAIRK